MQFPFETLTYQELKKLAERYPPLTERDQELLAAIAAGGNKEAQELLFKHNAQRILFFAEVFAPEGPGLRKGKRAPWQMRMMAKWRDYAPKTITIDDIISAASQGLWNAIVTFDPTRGKFNNHANVLIWQRIQSLRENEEKRQSREEELKIESIESSGGTYDTEDAEEGALFDGLEARVEDEFCKCMAQLLFEHYAQKLLSPEENARLGRMFSGEEEADPEWLGRISEKLRAGIPEGDWAFLAEWLVGG